MKDTWTTLFCSIHSNLKVPSFGNKLWLHYYAFINTYLTTGIIIQMVLCGNYSCHDDLEIVLNSLFGAARHQQTHLPAICKSSGHV